MKKSTSLIVICTVLLETVLIIIVNQQIYISKDISNLKVFLPLANLFVLVISGLAIVSIKKIEESVKKQVETTLLKAHLQQVESLLSTLQSQKHEHSRHLQTIQAMLYLEEPEKAREYIDGIADNYRHTEDMVYVGHPALTGLLNTKRKVAESKEIDFAFSIKCPLSEMEIQPWDLCSIIGNLVDNALEAAIEDDATRRVSLEIKQESNWYTIYVHNTGRKISDVEKKELFRAGYTTKMSEARGYGLYLVKKLVDGYGGKIEVYSGERTTFIVYLPMKGLMQDDKGVFSKNSQDPGGSVAG
ncbi:MAG: sensor histidine kinase [Acidobacteriota bacterium]